jgi:hypothetical protein
LAHAVLVHGIAHEQLTPDGVEAEWLPALAGTVRLAGRQDLADRIWPPRSRTDAIDIRMAFYGDLFDPIDQQGAANGLADLSPEQSRLAESLGREWLTRIVGRTRAGTPDAEQAQLALDLIRNPSQAQGIPNVLREIIRALSRNRWIAQVGMRVAERFVVCALTQVSRFLDDEELRSQIQERVTALIDADTRLVIGHSLGSVVAYEVAHRLETILPTLVTLGSPLGLKTIVAERIRPAPSFPPRVTFWLNVADRDAIVAAEPELQGLFAKALPEGARFQDADADNGSKPHDASHYLAKPAVGRAATEALSH